MISSITDISTFYKYIYKRGYFFAWFKNKTFKLKKAINLQHPYAFTEACLMDGNEKAKILFR